ncbi:hypothetical protein BGW80DRAFT_1447107 [Lactifluus volemus]|nr:hypothetical protein BGW80DRAFT_1447107 [Lactifluus volemus]
MTMARRRSASGGQDDLPTDFSIVPKDHRQHPTAASADLAILSGAAEQLRSTCPHLPLSQDAASAPPAATARTCADNRYCARGSIVQHVRRSTQKRKPTHQRQPVNSRRKNIKRAEATKPITSWNCSSNSSLYLIPTCKLRSDAPSFPLTPTPGVPTQPTENTSLAPPSPPRLVRLSLCQQTSHPSPHAPFSSPLATPIASHPLALPSSISLQSPRSLVLRWDEERFGGWDARGAQKGDVNDNDHKPLASDRSVKDKEIGVLPAFTVTVDDPENLKVGDILSLNSCPNRPLSRYEYTLSGELWSSLSPSLHATVRTFPF